MNVLAIIEDLRFRDLIDILFLTLVAYHLYLWFRGTKAFKALVGMLGLGIVFTAARIWGLFLTTWVFQIFWQVLVVLLIILFQSEIRQVLERVNPLRAFGLRRALKPAEWIPEFVRAVYALAERKIGAIIVIERLDRAKEWITEGQSLEGYPGYELLMSIFQKDSPLHDGAVLIKDGRLVEVACYLPLTPEEGLPKAWGTRHRAAIGLSERCDAWVVVVSEERGEVSLARDGKMNHVDGRSRLSDLIAAAITPTAPSKKSWQERIRFLFVHRWRIKLGSLALVSLLWLSLAGQQDFEVTLRVPVEVKNLPAGMEMTQPMNPYVEITVRGLRKDASTLNEENIAARIDLSSASYDKTVFPVSRDQVVLPNDRLQVTRVAPPRIEFTFREKPQP